LAIGNAVNEDQLLERSGARLIEIEGKRERHTSAKGVTDQG
jgi:hypothetical protein